MWEFESLQKQACNFQEGTSTEGNITGVYPSAFATSETI